MKIKQEVKKLCVALRNSELGSEKWLRIKEELQNKWKFSSFSLLALYYNPPVIEYDENNYHLIME